MDDWPVVALGSADHTGHYTTLHYTTLHYTTLHYTTLSYTRLQGSTWVRSGYHVGHHITRLSHQHPGTGLDSWIHGFMDLWIYDIMDLWICVFGQGMVYSSAMVEGGGALLPSKASPDTIWAPGAGTRPGKL